MSVLDGGGVQEELKFILLFLDVSPYLLYFVLHHRGFLFINVYIIVGIALPKEPMSCPLFN